MSAVKPARSNLPLLLLAATAVGSVLGAALYTSTSHVVLQNADTEITMDEHEPSTPTDLDDTEVSIPLDPSIFNTPVKRGRSQHTNTDILQSPRTTFLVESLDNYDEIYDRVDKRKIGLILKEDLIAELKQTLVLQPLSTHPDDPIAIVISRIDSTQGDYITRQEWINFCTSRIAKPNRKSKGLVVEDFRAVLDTVD